MKLDTIAVDMRMMHHSGIGTYISNLVPRMASICSDMQFHLMGDADDLNKQQWTRSKNVRVDRCASPIYSLGEQLEIPAHLHPVKELLWTPHYNIPVAFPGRLMVTIHDVFHLAMPQFVGGIHKRAYAQLVFSALKRRAHSVLCDSRFTADELIRLTGISHDKLHVVHLGVGSEWFTCKKAENPHPRPYLLFVGNVKPHKNLIGLLSVFESISERIPHDLMIVGKKEGFITADTKVGDKAAALGDRVCFTGYVEFDVLQQYYLHADCLILPSLYEGFGLPPLEAMACGCPVICSETCSLPEVCGDAAVYCDPTRIDSIASRILMLVNDLYLQEELRSKGRERASSFTWDRTAAQTAEILRSAVG